MTNLQDKIAALEAEDYDVVFEGTPYMMIGHASMHCVENAAKVIVLEEQVRVLREAGLMAKMFIENCGYEDSTTYAKLLDALVATDMGE